MNKYIILLFWFIPYLGLCQVKDDFSDGDFSQKPVWFGDSLQFEVNSQKELHLKSEGSDTSTLVTQDSLFHETEWNFWIKLSFNTSANNNARIYLLSDKADLKGSLNGYYIQFGGTNDSLSLVMQNGTLMRTLIHVADIYMGNSINTLRIKTTLDALGNWRIYADHTGGASFSEVGSYIGSHLTGKYWFGVFVKYTTSNASKFYFDDLYIGPVIHDTLPPVVKDVRFQNDRDLDILFSESVEKTTAETISNYSLVENGIPLSATQDTLNRALIKLIMQHSVISGFRDTLKLQNIKDLVGNVLLPAKIPVTYYVEKTFDVLINEIMSDPDPPGGLPECEYIELYNSAEFPICLLGWTLEYGNYSKIFPDVTMLPRSFLLLTKGTALEEFGPTVNLFTSSTALSNEGTTLVLKNKEGHVIHNVTYSTDWYGDPLKSGGGWSLEQIDVLNPCGCEENWRASTDFAGGTPGRINSVCGTTLDTVPPFIQRAWFAEDDELDFLFSEPLDSTRSGSLNEWETYPYVGKPDSSRLFPPDFTHARLFFPKYFVKDCMYRVIGRHGLTDCVGNSLDTNMTILIGFADQASLSDIVINEILPDPVPEGERFIELFNRSQKIFDLKQLILTSFDSVSNELTDCKEISTASVLLFPEEYVVLTKNQKDIMSRYLTPGRDHFLQMSSLPSMSDQKGIIVLARRNDHLVIDKVQYFSEMQYPLLYTNQGVSLERLSPEIRSEDRKNWHSASESCGFATPGYQNSQYQKIRMTEEVVTLFPDVFSPDNDGKDDVLTIICHLDSPDYIANISIFDSKGRFVKQLVKNRFLSATDYIIWDGINEMGMKVVSGIYIVYFELLNPGGQVSRFKKATVVCSRH